MHLPDVLVGTSLESCNNKVTVNISQGPALDYLQTIPSRSRINNNGKPPDYIVFVSQDINIDLPLVVDGHRNAPDILIAKAKQARATRKNKRSS